MEFRDGVAMPLSYRLLGVVILAVGVTGCGTRFLPREFATVRDAFERYGEPMQTRTFAATAADVYRAAELATRHAGLILEDGEEAARVILATRTPQSRRGTAYFYRISIRESAPRRTHVVVATKMQRQRNYGVPESRTVHAAYCKRIATPHWESSDAGESHETSRQFLALIRSNLMEAGALPALVGHESPALASGAG